MGDLKLCVASDFNDGNHLYNGLCYEAATPSHQPAMRLSSHRSPGVGTGYGRPPTAFMSA